MKHTATPWVAKVEERFSVQHIDIVPIAGADGRPVCVVPGQVGAQDHANADFIVLACNQHEALKRVAVLSHQSLGILVTLLGTANLKRLLPGDDYKGVLKLVDEGDRTLFDLGLMKTDHGF